MVNVVMVPLDGSGIGEEAVDHALRPTSTGGALMAEELNISQRERDVLVRCIGDAYETLRVLPDVDPNGPALVWLASHPLGIHRRNDAPVHA